MPIVLIMGVIALGFGVGIFFIVGAMRRWTVLFNPPDARYVPSFWLSRRLFGEKYLRVIYIVSGCIFISVALLGAIHVIRGIIVAY